MALATNFPLLAPDGTFTCPRCAQGTRLIWSGAVLQPLAGRCQRCEHSYQFTTGAPSTTLTGGHAQGAAALTVAAGAAFSTVGAWIVVDSTSVDGGAEVLKTSGAGGSTSIPVAATPLRLSHTGGATVQTAVLVPLGPLT
jgi:hypothetical protein